MVDTSAVGATRQETSPPDQLIDLLGARLLLEQTSVQLYDALIIRLDHADYHDDDQPMVERPTDWPGGGPTPAALIAIRNEKADHVRMLIDLLTDLGADPAIVTPSAIRDTVAIRGLVDVVHDPASSVLDALEALVIAELADHEQWVGLVELAHEIQRDDFARTFLTAQAIEHKHLSTMRSWISAGRAAHREVAA